ncbi:MAG: hypothetical protein AUJ08_08130 [Thaumarchaeota archaeon 13_1_40CM_3_50_5]|nr:MAG: hypothetical protein AUH71_01210 [Thaumarchaeota archaeon 13_1_40CM_4_48_7]OLC80827.1 MAG: hypothetical protein AUJ08_08130 [Thaumarchaeota archaeon 13_1_40CM_3_50_5]
MTTSTGAKAKFVYPLVARWAPLTVLYFPSMLAVHLEVGIYLWRHAMAVFAITFLFAARH